MAVQIYTFVSCKISLVIVTATMIAVGPLQEYIYMTSQCRLELSAEILLLMLK